MEQKVEEQLLFDFYAELLTPHQREILSMYFEEDLGLTEIAEVTGRSRQNAYDILKRSRRQMHEYETKLGLMNRFLENKQKISQIRSRLERLTENPSETCMMQEEILGIVDTLRELEEDG